MGSTSETQEFPKCMSRWHNLHCNIGPHALLKNITVNLLRSKYLVQQKEKTHLSYSIMNLFSSVIKKKKKEEKRRKLFQRKNLKTNTVIIVMQKLLGFCVLSVGLFFLLHSLCRSQNLQHYSRNGTL